MMKRQVRVRPSGRRTVLSTRKGWQDWTEFDEVDVVCVSTEFTLPFSTSNPGLFGLVEPIDFYIPWIERINTRLSGFLGLY